MASSEVRRLPFVRRRAARCRCRSGSAMADATRRVAFLGDAFVDVQTTPIKQLPRWGQDETVDAVHLLPGDVPSLTTLSPLTPSRWLCSEHCTALQ